MAEVLMVIGSLNRETPYFESARGVGLSVFSFDKRDGRASLFCEDGSIDNPTFLALHPGNGCLYAASEVFGWHEGTVSAYRFDHGARRLAYINKQPTLGSIAAHVSLDPSGRYLFVANYGDGPVDAGPDCAITLLPLRPDGGLAPAAASAAHKGRGPRSGRQDRSHAHCALPSPDGRFVIVVDLGLDALMTYAVGHRGTLSAAPVARASLAPGSGPRHAVFPPNGRLVLVISESESTVTSLASRIADGDLPPDPPRRAVRLRREPGPRQHRDPGSRSRQRGADPPGQCDVRRADATQPRHRPFGALPARGQPGQSRGRGHGDRSGSGQPGPHRRRHHRPLPDVHRVCSNMTEPRTVGTGECLRRAISPRLFGQFLQARLQGRDAEQTRRVHPAKPTQGRAP